MRRFLIAVLALILGTSGIALAQQPDDPATKEEIAKLFELMHTRRQFDEMMGVFSKQVPAIVERMLEQQLPNATPEQRAAEKKFINDMTSNMFKGMPYDDLMQALQVAYQHHFTHRDVQLLTEFYSTATGQKMINDMPAIMAEYLQEATPALQKWEGSMLEDVKKQAEEFARTLQKDSKKVSPPAKKPAKS